MVILICSDRECIYIVLVLFHQRDRSSFSSQVGVRKCQAAELFILMSVLIDDVDDDDRRRYGGEDISC